MNKSDLKTGMMVVTRGGSKYVVMVGVSFSYGSFGKMDVLVSKDDWLRFDSLNDDLSCHEISELGIVEVYEPRMGASLWKTDQIEDDFYWKCIWKREEPSVEMTVAEIEKKLGIKNLKIVKEHGDE